MSLSDLGRYAGKAGKKAAEMGRFFASEWLREPGAQQMLMKKAEPFLKSGIDQLSTATRPKKKYKTNRKDLDGGAVDIHNLIMKLPKPKKKGFTLPGHNSQALETRLKNKSDLIKRGKFLKLCSNPQEKQMQFLCSTMLIIQSAQKNQIHVNAKIKQTGKWLPLWMRFPGKKDSGVMLWHEIPLMQNKNWVWVP